MGTKSIAARNRSQQPRQNADATAALGLLLLAVVPYLNTLGNSFVYDDNQQILENPYVHSFHYLKDIFGSTVWTWEGTPGVTNYYRPLMTFGYLVWYKLFGPLPFGFHLLNLALHAGVVVLLYAVTKQLLGERLPALIAAGLFALHPIHTESVAWIAGVTDLELSFFFLLTFLLYLRLGDGDTNGENAARWPSFIFMTACYALALLSKEQAMVLPALAIAYEHFYRADRKATSLGVKISRYAPLCAVVVAYLVFRHFVLGAFAPANNRADLPWTAVVLSGIALIGAYLWKLIWPAHLLLFYVFRESRHMSDPRVLGGIAGLLVCLALFIWLWRTAHAVSFSLVWMGATIAPVLNVHWMPAQVFAERYLYLPSAGFCWIVAWAATSARRASRARTVAPAIPSGPPKFPDHKEGFSGHASRAGIAPEQFPTERLPGRSARNDTHGLGFETVAPVALALLAALYGIRTVRRNRDWHTEDVLYAQTLAEEPDAQIIRTDLGAIDWEHGKRAAAEKEWTTALGPNRPYSPTLNDMGLVRERQKRYDEAIEFFNQALLRRPQFMPPHKNLGDTYTEMGRLDDADREYRIAVSMAPLSTLARNAYGHFLLDHGRTMEAREQFELSAAADPNSEAEENLGNILLGETNFKDARTAYEATVKLDPFDSRAHFGLASVDEHDGRIVEEIREYRTGLQTDPRNAEALAAMRRLAEQGAP